MSRLDPAARAKAIEAAASILADIERIVPGAETSPPYLRLICNALLDADEDTALVDAIEAQGGSTAITRLRGSRSWKVEFGGIDGTGEDLRSAFREAMKGSQ